MRFLIIIPFGPYYSFYEGIFLIFLGLSWVFLVFLLGFANFGVILVSFEPFYDGLENTEILELKKLPSNF